MDDLSAETRGKCSVTLLSEVETPASYTGRSDAFFYSLVFDPHQKSLVADRGEIRIGSSYQATVTPLQNKRQREADRKGAAGALDEMIWDPTNRLDKEDVEKYLTVAKSGSTISCVPCSTRRGCYLEKRFRKQFSESFPLLAWAAGKLQCTTVELSEIFYKTSSPSYSPS